MRFRRLSAAVLLVMGLTACSGEPLPAYVEPSTGARMMIQQSVDPSRFSNSSVRIEVARYIENCKAEYLGEVAVKDAATGFLLPTGQKLVVTASFVEKGFNSSSELSEGRVFTPKRGATYTLDLIYNDIGYAMNVIENGRKLPFSRACSY